MSDEPRFTRIDVIILGEVIVELVCQVPSST